MFNLTQNQFAQLPVLGQLDELGFGSNVIAAAVSNSATGALVPLVPGQPVKVANEGSPLPTVLPLAANSDVTDGFIAYNVKDAAFAADQRLELAIGGSVMYMNSGAAITRWGQVEVVYNTVGNVIASAGVNPVIGFAFDQATAANQLIRVYIENTAEVATTIGSISGLQAALNALQAPVLPYEAETSITTSVGGTLTAAGIVGKLIKRSGPTAAFSDATDTALAIVAALNTYVAGSSFEVKIKNTTVYPMTITAGSGVTLTGTAVIQGNSVATYLVTITSTTAVAMEFVQAASYINGGSSVLPVSIGASATVTTAQAGTTFLLNTAAGSVATLPAATGSGSKYVFVVSTTATSNAHKILAASTADFIIGLAAGFHTTTTTIFASPGATNHSIQMPFTGTQPSGGFIGDKFEFQDIGANLWECTGMFQAGTAPTTPFSTADS